MASAGKKVVYFGSNLPVLPGDRVLRKGWLGKQSGEVIYVPGVSEHIASFHEGGYGQGEVVSCGIKFASGRVIGEVVYPESGELREIIFFVSRGEASPTDLSEIDE